MDSSRQERVTAKLVARMVTGPRAGEHPTVQSGPTNKWEGASGHQHQIDVSVEWAGERLILVECKVAVRNTSISVSDALVHYGRVHDIQRRLHGLQVEGWLVTNKPIQAGATKICSHYGITVHTVTSPTEFMLEFRPRAGEGPVHVHIGVTDGAVFGDEVSATVIHNGQVADGAVVGDQMSATVIPGRFVVREQIE